ncbi:restriction endonuclease subunit S [Haloferula sargassicola]|uniref:Type-1 restriction enzyme EcoKI specificity protein n=1 Tax=Haloferula sargassicola TaxID=490096 RepID=A0ABP9USU7_9BACT
MPLGEIADVKGGITLNKAREVEDPIEVPHLRVANVQRGHLDLSEIKRVVIERSRRDDYMLQPGDILFNEGGDRDKLGRGWVWNGEIPGCCHQNHVFRARPDTDRVDSKFVSYWANEFGRAYFEREGKQTTNLASINRAKLCALPVPLPPLPEQRRIVARIEELFSRLDSGVAALRHAKAQLQRYRQSVLAAAVTGQLTQAWREQHPDTAPQAEQFDLFGTPLPEGWACPKFIEVISEGPRNGFSPQCGSSGNGSNVLKLSATSSCRMLLNDNTVKISIEPVDPDSHAWLQPNDVLIQRANSLELLGSTAIYEGPENRYVYPDLMMRIRVAEPATRKLLAIYLNSLPARNYFQRNATGVAGNMPKINGATLKALPVPFPPLAEQHQIVAEVEARTTAIDHLEAELDRQITRSNRLRQSVLAAGFSGRLC